MIQQQRILYNTNSTKTKGLMCSAYFPMGMVSFCQATVSGFSAYPGYSGNLQTKGYMHVASGCLDPATELLVHPRFYRHI